MSKTKVDVNRGSERAGSTSASARGEAKPAQDLVAAVATIGVIAAGLALVEITLIPGLVIGGAAVLAPRCLPNLRRRLWPMANPTRRQRSEPAVALSKPEDVKAAAGPAGLGIKQALVKTVTFRIIVTTLDFTSNYLVIGELGTAAGLSAFALVVGPIFYFSHEAAWNHFGAPIEGEAGRWGPVIEVPLPLPLRSATGMLLADRRRLTINRALAKTITFRTIATTIDFTATYVVVGELATAAALSAFGFVLGPFVSFGHEMAWDYFNSRRQRALPPPAPAIPAQASA
jgi:uncharacterized membrane protein